MQHLVRPLEALVLKKPMKTAHLGESPVFDPSICHELLPIDCLALYTTVSTALFIHASTVHALAT